MARTHITRRQLAGLAAAATTAPGLIAQPRATTPTPTGPTLDLADWGYYYYGIERVKLARGTMANGGQIYVEHWIPRTVRHQYPIVLVNGGRGQAIDWTSTPDGRAGWVSMLVEAGYKVYAVDRPGQGRSPWAPLLHGQAPPQAPTFESVAAMVKGGTGHTQWPGDGSAASREIMQLTAQQGQQMGRGDVTIELWGSRGVELLKDIGPAIFLTHGDGCAFAYATAAIRPELVKAIIAVEQPANGLQGIAAAKLKDLPIAAVTAEATGNASAHLDLVTTLSRAGAKAVHMNLPDRGIRGNGPFVMMEKNSREALQPILGWLDGVYAPIAPTPGLDPARNVDTTSMKIGAHGNFWVGVLRKQMSYGTIPLGQMHVQYIIPAEQRHPNPIVMVHGGGGQGTHMMGIGRRPGWVHYFVQAGYAVYWVDRPSYGRSPYHADALGASHLPIVPPYEGLLQSTGVFNTGQFPGTPTMDDPNVNQFMAVERGNVSDEAFHSDLVWPGGVELLERIGPSILFVHAFGGFFAWGVADRRPDLVKAIACMEINGNPFAAQLRWGLTAQPMTYDPPVSAITDFKLVDVVPPPDMPRPIANPYKLQAEPARKWKNLGNIPVSWMTSEYGAGGSPVAQVAFLKQVGMNVDMLRLRDNGIVGNGNLMLLERNNHEIFTVLRDWLEKKVRA
jgi:pimeloyl-ACP methyl ester carboxylesterase